ncbi:DUF2071 domain-containing protein [Acidipila sp. EB88]|nr:DUF2071 domain-containing protein [Acidipila sp. EB88]
MPDVLRTTDHRPGPLPDRPWAMQQRWNDLLFAHWPMPAAAIAPTLPPDLVVDTFDGSAWLGVVPFGMDRIRIHGLPSVPGARSFPELNLRTYVRERGTNRAGVYFYSLDASNPLAVAVARAVFHLPYFWAKMQMQYGPETGRSRQIIYRSERLLGTSRAGFSAQYRGLGLMAQGPLEHFLTARYALYTADRRGTLLRGDIHHLPWPLERAEAEFERNDLPAAHGFTLPHCAPVLHYSRELMVYVWTLQHARPGRSFAQILPQAKAQPSPVGSPIAGSVSVQHP